MIKSTIAIFFPSLEYIGGIERVIVEHARIFKERGHNCFLLTDVKVVRLADKINIPCFQIPTDKENRSIFLKKFLTDNGVNNLIIHNAFYGNAVQDIQDAQSCKTKVILNIHFSFPSPVLFNESYDTYQRNKEIGSLCDAVATVSSIDAYWWRALGCNAFSVQNPFVRYQNSDEDIKRESHTIIWVGRHAEQKLPFEAIEVMALVAKEISDAKLLMIGGETGNKAFNKRVRQLGIENNVVFQTSVNDIGRFYKQASIHLLTSITESFCLVIAEAKSFKLPTVMYDIPFLDIISDNKGVVRVPRWNREELAKELIHLLENPVERERIGEEAYETLTSFTDGAVLQSWESIFNSLEQKNNVSESADEKNYQIIIRELYDAWNYHCKKNQWKINIFDDYERFTGHSCKGLIDFMAKHVINPIKKIRRR